MNIFEIKLFAEVTTFTCTIIFALFHFMNKEKLRGENITPSEWKSQVRDAKLEEILNGHKYTKRIESRIIKGVKNKHLVIPNCGKISLISCILFIIITYLEVKHII